MLAVVLLKLLLQRNPNFVPVAIGDDLVDFPPEVWKELSTDFKHLYLLVISIRSGVIHASLYDVTLGLVSHARWYTTVNRLCLLYISDYEDLLSDKSKAVLKLLIEYIGACLLYTSDAADE